VVAEPRRRHGSRHLDQWRRRSTGEGLARAGFASRADDQISGPDVGIYNCRPIAGTVRLSVHAFGAAIDINAHFGDYWLWAKRPDGSIV
jgi:hypothetical protein